MVLTRSFLRRLACQGLRFVIALAVAALPLLAQNRIERVVVGSEDRASLTFDVDYDYSGDHGAADTVGGGYILGPAHLFQPDVPPENILAMYDAV